jgi:hypothetical protein
MLSLRVISLVISFGFTANAVAHHVRHYNPFEPQFVCVANCWQNHIDVAYQYPHQIAAAAQWYRNHRHVNLHANPTVIAHFNWHPSVVALLYHPQFFTQIYIQPNWYNNWRQGQWNRRGWQQKAIVRRGNGNHFGFSNKKVRVRRR